MAERSLFILIFGALTIWFVSCNLNEVAFPVVVTGVPEENESGKLEVDFTGTLELENMDDLGVIEEYGFAWSPENPLPDPTTDFTVLATLDQLTLRATLTDPLLNYDQDQYFVRAYIRIKDDNRNDYIVAQDRQRFSFNSKFSIVTGFPSIVQDRITTTSLIEYVNGFTELIEDHGHIYSKTSGATLGACNGPDCVFVSLGDTLADASMFSTSIQGDYNTRYYITPVVDLEGQIIYGDEVEVVLTGGLNRSSNYPFIPGIVLPLYDGIAMSVGEYATSGYVGVGNALFEVTTSDDDVHALVYDRMTNYPPELGQQEYRGGTGFVVSEYVCIYPGEQVSSNALETRIFCYSENTDSWETFNPSDSVSFAGRVEAVSFVIDDHAYIGFGRIGASSSFDFLDFCPSCPVGDQLRLFRPAQDFRVPQRGQVAAVIDDKAYITTGKGSGQTQLELMRFTPDGGNGKWENLMPLDAPEGRWNAFGFALDGNFYVGFGQDLDDLSIDTSDDIWVYDPSLNKWSEYDYETPTITERSRAVGFTLNGRGYFGSGQTSLLSALTDMWVLTPNRIE